jgi:hypothetical protein
MLSPRITLLAAGSFRSKADKKVLPPAVGRVPFPPTPHPAFVWLRAQDLLGKAVADVAAWDDTTLVLYVRGETVWSTLETGQPTVAGASSVWPAQAARLNAWLGEHPHPFSSPDFAPLLRSYGVRYLVFHMLGTGEGLLVSESSANPEFRLVDTFPPPDGPGAWPYPIAIVEVL